MKPNRTRLKTRVAVRFVRSIRLGIKDMFAVDQILDSWFSLQNPMDNLDENLPAKVHSQLARDWVRIHAPKLDITRLNSALGRLYAEAYILGEDITTYELARAVGIQKAAPNKKQMQRALTINWNKWRAGNRAAAALVDPPESLRRLLQSRSIVIQGITNTTLNRIGTALAEGLERGATRKEVADDISYIIGDDSRAITIAGTEMSRAVVQASKDLYADSGVEKIQYLVADPCDECQENYDASPIDIGEQFPNGDPPVHPNCMCDIAPYVVDTGLWEYVYGEESE